jgi:hypothetical protein
MRWPLREGNRVGLVGTENGVSVQMLTSEITLLWFRRLHRGLAGALLCVAL